MTWLKIQVSLWIILIALDINDRILMIKMFLDDRLTYDGGPALKKRLWNADIKDTV